MSKTPYIPRPGSMPSKLMQHLQQHPGAAFTSAAIAKTFDVNAAAVQTALAPAVVAQLLLRTPTGQPRRQYHYTAGPKLASFDLTPQPKATPQPAATPAAPPVNDPLRQYGSYCARTDTVSLDALQRDHLNMVIGAFALAAAAAATAAQAAQEVEANAA